MWRIFAYFSSILLTLIGSILPAVSQDTISFPLKIKVGMEVSGPAIYISQKNPLSTEGYIAMDLNEKISAVLGGGYLNYKHSQYNSSDTLIYRYLNNGFFLRTGVDFNLLAPEKSMGKYWAGLGLRYGLSVFNSEVPYFRKDNYWGSVESSLAKETNWGHFLEVSPFMRAEVFRNISIGWTISIRMLLYSGTGKDRPPVNFPGFGNGTKNVSTGLNYFIVWNIPYKKITVIKKKEVPEETDDTDTTNSDSNSNSINNSNSNSNINSNRQPGGIRK